MAKRHPALVPVARDHHDGLLLAIRLQQGDRAELKLWSHDPVLQTEYVLAFYDQHLTRHFTVEEEQVFALGRDIRDAVALIDHLTDQHRQIASIVNGLRSDPPADRRPVLQSLGRLLEEHIRLEDRKLFPLLEAQVPPAELQTAQAAIERYYA
ncbi:MAG: hemerythrin domain-containing protein [Bacteroidetes bacterium]|jgi:hemerythrin-like domain-containing protein|nr:hemerythrin domain-containing protein [Bacteroidota bacterium]